MKKHCIFVLLIGAVVVVGTGTLGFVLGKESTTSDTSNDSDTALYYDTFYGEITQIDENTIQVDGLDVNDINYRDEFYLSADADTQYLWRGTEITRADLQVGDVISITHTGDVTETSPAGITEVLRIQLLR